jgi:hypothetical protein
MTAYLIDPNATLDYVMDWSEWLEVGETISTYTVVALNGTIDSHTELNGAVTYWLTAAQHPARVTCHIETSQGRVDDRTDIFTVRQR